MSLLGTLEDYTDDEGTAENQLFGAASPFQVNQGQFKKMVPRGTGQHKKLERRQGIEVQNHMHGVLSDSFAERPLHVPMSDRLDLLSGSRAEWMEGALLLRLDVQLRAPQRLRRQLRRRHFFPAIRNSASPVCYAIFT